MIHDQSDDIRDIKIKIRISERSVKNVAMVSEKSQIFLFNLFFIWFLSRKSGEEDQSAAGLLLRTYSAGPVSQTCLLRSKRRELLRALTIDDSTPQRRISELRVWSYEPFIVPAPSSSGYLSGQNLEVLYIIRNII